MKWVIALVAVIGLGTVVATLVVGSRVAEEKVTPDPYAAGLEWDAEQRRARTSDCAVSEGPCSQQSGTHRLTLEVTPRPVRPMVDLEFAVAVEPRLAEATGEIALSMPGMYMGENRVPLVVGPDGRLHGKGVVVRCPSGRRTWSAGVTVRAPGTAVSAVFTFELAE